MTNFEICYMNTNQLEGGYANNKNDKGGETYRGIARNIWPNWPGWKIVDAAKAAQNFPESLDENEMLQQLIHSFYRVEFWNEINGDLITNIDVAKEVYDNAVNLGVGTSTKYLQRSLNVLNRNQIKYDDVVVDGDIGKKTIVAIDQCIKVNGVKRLVNVINAFQVKHYLELMEKNPTQEEFVGWLNRVQISWS